MGLRERKKIDTRARILGSASSLFARHGIEAVTVDEIAAAAGVGKGTVYNYFAAKEDIAVAFLVEMDREALRTIALLPAPGMSVAEALDTACWRLLEYKPPHHGFVRIALARSFVAEHPPFELAEFEAQLDAALTRLFERLLARPGMRRSTPVADLVASFRTMHLGITARWALEGPPFAATRQVARRHMALLGKGMEL